ncbi:MAG: DUF6441 family protein [Caulobacter sp.]|nr:DUF6441 family protein [Caulobacter sp.]
MTDLRLGFAIQGDLERWSAQVRETTLRAIKASALETGVRGQEILRGEVLGARLGQGLANAWRLDVYPPGQKLAWEPTVFLHHNAGHIIEAFTKGEPIKGERGLLAVPIPGSPAYDMKVPRRGGKRVAAVEARFGPLRLVVLKGGLKMLVASGRQNKSGNLVPLAKVRHRGSGATFTPLNQPRAEIPMFWLVPQVRLEPRLHWPRLAQQIEAAYGPAMEANLRRFYAAMEAAADSRRQAA